MLQIPACPTSRDLSAFQLSEINLPSLIQVSHSEFRLRNYSTGSWRTINLPTPWDWGWRLLNRFAWVTTSRYTSPQRKIFTPSPSYFKPRLLSKMVINPFLPKDSDLKYLQFQDLWVSAEGNFFRCKCCLCCADSLFVNWFLITNFFYRISSESHQIFASWLFPGNVITKKSKLYLTNSSCQFSKTKGGSKWKQCKCQLCCSYHWASLRDVKKIITTPWLIH